MCKEMDKSVRVNQLNSVPTVSNDHYYICVNYNMVVNFGYSHGGQFPDGTYKPTKLSKLGEGGGGMIAQGASWC